MRYTSEEGGLLNNFAAEPKMYSAEPPNANQQKLYVILGVVALALVGGLFAIAVSVS
jgi:hypothetical protein